jgi:UDP-N-acetylmuramoyl-tripeptide--D-alanyl-D-alanine ligase
MIRMTLGALAAPLGGTVRGGDAAFTAVCTDTRRLAPGELFVALTGPSFDGHTFVGQAAVHGAVAAIVSRRVDVAMPCLTVPDTRVALGQLGALWRQASHARVVAITGSNGKTTLKEMTAAILRRRGRVLATAGNLNNDVGVPLTLVRLQDEDYAVVEMGANHLGEIGYLSGLTRPDVAVLNNAGRAHLEGFGSPEAVARGKAEIVTGLRDDGVFVYNADSPWAPLWREIASGRPCLRFGLARDADVTSPGQALLQWDAAGFAQRFEVHADGSSTEVQLALLGEHNRMNALAAAAAALAAGATLADVGAGLATVRPVAGRLAAGRRADGGWMVDDSYNANPDSVAAAIAVLATAPGGRVLVLGDLAELGAGAAALHAALGEQARAAGIGQLYTVGTLSAAASQAFGPHARHFGAQAELIQALRGAVRPDDVVLVKGSRSARMEKVVEALAAEGGLTC